MVKIRFNRYAWGVLAYTLSVILGGAVVRATTSGDGCGDRWPSCNGAFIPLNGQVKTFIEFSHRVSSGPLLLPLIAGLVIWAFIAYPKGHPSRKGATLALVFTLVEAMIGASLVLFHLVAHDKSVPRAIIMPVHLVTTFLLLGSLTLTAWWSSGGKPPRVKGQGAMAWGLGMGLVGVLILGISGAITALGDTLFPAGSLSEGLKQDLSPSAHFLIHLRLFHPLIAMSVGLYLVLIAGLSIHLRPSEDVRRFARWVGIVFAIQLVAGVVNLLLLAPIWMQLTHLLLADLLWLSIVLLAASALAEGVPQVELAAVESAREKRGSFIGGATWREYVALTKPRVISLLLLTTLAAMYIAARAEHRPWPSVALVLCTAIGFYMAAGAANAINMVLERDLDVRMARTSRRPTVTQRIPPRSALGFAFGLMAGSFGLLWVAANLLSAMLALAGLVFYVIVYTLLLKRRTWTNIVIGGAAGAFPPLVGWAAVTGDLSPLAWCLFGIIFLWTPVHFWALAILIKDDYARAGVPMLPVVQGERATVIQIAMYAVLTVVISTMPLLIHQKDGQSVVGWFYLGAAALLNVGLLLRSLQLYRHPDRPRASVLFKYSMVYLALLFLAMALDGTHRI